MQDNFATDAKSDRDADPALQSLEGMLASYVHLILDCQREIAFVSNGRRCCPLSIKLTVTSLFPDLPCQRGDKGYHFYSSTTLAKEVYWLVDL